MWRCSAAAVSATATTRSAIAAHSSRQTRSRSASPARACEPPADAVDLVHGDRAIGRHPFDDLHGVAPAQIAGKMHGPGACHRRSCRHHRGHPRGAAPASVIAYCLPAILFSPLLALTLRPAGSRAAAGGSRLASRALVFMKGARFRKSTGRGRCESSRISLAPARAIRAISQRWFVASQHGLDEITKAKLLLVLLAFVWGLSWPIMTIALAEISVWTLRVLGFSISALSLFALIRLQGRSAAIPRGVTWLHIVAASHVQRRRLRAVQLVCLARGHHLAGRDRQLFHADLGEPDGLADSRRAPEHQGGHRFGVVRQRTDRARLSGGDGAVGGRAAACALLRAQLGRRHGLHEMGAHAGRLARHHGVADRARRGRLRCGAVDVPRSAGAGGWCRSKPFWRWSTTV